MSTLYVGISNMLDNIVLIWSLDISRVLPQLTDVALELSVYLARIYKLVASDNISLVRDRVRELVMISVLPSTATKVVKLTSLAIFQVTEVSVLFLSPGTMYLLAITR